MNIDELTLKRIVAALPKCRVADVERTTDKVFGYDQCYAIPKGEASLAFFTFCLGTPACYVLKRNGQGFGIKSAKQYIASFDFDIAAGTLLAGTLFDSKGRVFFCIQDILQYAGDVVADLDMKARMAYTVPLLKRLNPANYGKTCVSFGLPVCAQSYKSLSKRISTLPYDVSDVVYASGDWRTVKIRTRNIPASSPSTHQNRLCIVKVIPYPEHDIYELVPNKSRTQRWAAVQTLADSKALNAYFRKIRENRDLDLTEMSGDEEMFEDTSETKYIKRKMMVMECEYIPTLKKWRPIRPSKERISDEETLIQIETHSTR